MEPVQNTTYETVIVGAIYTISSPGLYFLLSDWSLRYTVSSISTGELVCVCVCVCVCARVCVCVCLCACICVCV